MNTSFEIYGVYSSAVLFFIFRNTVKNNTTQIIIINIKLQITIAAISPLLSFASFLVWTFLDGHVSGNSDDFWTLKDPNVSLEYVEYVIINDNCLHPENELS